MALEDLKCSERVIGVKQVTKAVKRGVVSSVYLADDADERVICPLSALCNEANVPVMHAATMQALGAACGIEVGAAAAAILADGR